MYVSRVKRLSTENLIIRKVLQVTDITSTLKRLLFVCTHYVSYLEHNTLMLFLLTISAYTQVHTYMRR